MAKSSNQKLKLLYLLKIFMEETDEQHGLTMTQIIDKLSRYEVSANRKTLYADFEELRHFGIDIIVEHTGNQYFYFFGSRTFEIAELKLLVDSVQGAKFITARKSASLIKKLGTLVSKYEATQLQRQVTIAGRVKTMNESIYYNIDKIHASINANAQIKFKYFQWNEKKEMVLRHDGAWYHVSPWRLIWDDEYYYLVAYDSKENQMKHYRVDKMLHITVEAIQREGRKNYESSITPNYSTRHFGMYGGPTVQVVLLGENQLAGVIIDRFGKDVTLIPYDETHFKAYVDVSVSDIFLGWVIGLGPAIKVVEPGPVVDAMQKMICRLRDQYNVNK